MLPRFFVLFCNCILCISSAQPPVSTFPSPEIGKGKLTVGKIYGGLLILENWKTTKFGKIPNSQRPVNILWLCYQFNLFSTFFNRQCCTKSVIIVTFHPFDTFSVKTYIYTSFPTSCLAVYKKLLHRTIFPFSDLLLLKWQLD